MKNKKILKPVLLLVLSVAIIFFIFCTSKKPTKYEPKSYMLYVQNGMRDFYGGGIYIIDTRSDTFTDTIHFDRPGMIQVSPDGASLHMARLEGDTINGEPNYYYMYYEFDTRTKSIKYKGPHGGITITPNGKYLFHGMNIVDAKTHQLVHSDSIQPIAAIPAFDRNAPLVYVGALKRGTIGIFNYNTLKWVRFFEIVLKVGQTPTFMDLLVSPDGKTLYFVAQIPISNHGIFGAYDLANDSLVEEFQVNSPYGDLAVTNNGMYVYITDPAAFECFDCLQPTQKIAIYETQNNTIMPPIALDSFDVPDVVAWYTRWIVVQPVEDKAYIASWPGPVIFVLDTKNNVVIDTIMFSSPPGPNLGTLAIQSL